ncbi:MAG: DUF6049 family protein, partial [Kofleriaceae bacterium]
MSHRWQSLQCVAVAALLSFTASSCGNKSSTPPPPSSGPEPRGSAAEVAAPADPSAPYVRPPDAPPGLDVALSDGKQGPPAVDRRQLAPARPLVDRDVEALLARTRPIAADPSDAQSFALRPGSRPPPRTGTPITGSFPPPASSLLPPPPASQTSDKLAVVRWMPEGVVRLAPELSVTFSQPMVAVTSQDDAAATTPVKLTPQPPGKWRWIGTRTILFDPEVRFPQATTYQVEIPAGTRSATGGVLDKATRFTFETPPPTLEASFPGDGAPQHLDTPLFARFDQRIDPQVALAAVQVTAGGRTLPIRALDAGELAQLGRSTRDDERAVHRLIEHANREELHGRWIAFRTVQPLPANAAVKVEVKAGMASAEGPNRTRTASQFTFRSYAPLRVERAECGYGSRCPPGSPFVFQLNNPLDADKFDPASVTVTPAIDGMRVEQSYAGIFVSGATRPRTTYKVSLARGVVDAFGQQLGRDSEHRWTVGDASPTFFGPSGVVVLDPAAKQRTLDFFSTNYPQLKVHLYRVEIGDFPAFQSYQRGRIDRGRPVAPPGKKVVDRLVSVAGGKNALVETAVDLAPALGPDGLGHVLAIVEPSPWTQPWDPPRMVSWVQSTRLGIDAHVDADQLIAVASELEGGKPVAGAQVELRPAGVAGTTDPRGMATLALPSAAGQSSYMLTVRRGNDVAFVGETDRYWSELGSWIQSRRPVELAWYVVDDRKLYKPGEQVSIKGWLRRLDPGKGGDLGGDSGVVSVSYKVRDSRGNELATGTTPVSAVGGFDAKFALPKTPNLGHARIELTAGGRDLWSAPGNARYDHSFQIEEFRTPEFEVAAQASQGPFLVGDSGDVTVTAKYFSGGPLPGAPVIWTASAERTTFTPPNRDDFVFGTWEPWWGYRGRYRDDPARPDRAANWTLSGKTDASGAHALHLDFRSVTPAVPMSVTTSASVTDVNRQAWSASSTLLVHPASLYVGLRPRKMFVDRGKPFELDVIGVDLDGKPALGAKVEVVAARLETKFEKGKYTTSQVDPQRCAPAIGKDAAPCTFATPRGGTYLVTATILDGRGRPNQSTMTFWVTGGEQPRGRDVAQEVVEIIPDKKEYAAGNTAELLIQAPFYPAEGVVSWRRSGIVKTERIELTGPTRVITVPISDAMVPNMYVQVDLVGMAPRLDDHGDPDPKLPKRPAYASGTINLPVPPKQRTLAVEVAPQAPKLAPGERARLAVEVKDAAGRPQPGAEVAVIVVDEAVLALTGYKHTDPIDAFYRHRGADARDYYSRGYLKLAKPVVDGLSVQTGGLGFSGVGPGGGGVGYGYGVGGDRTGEREQEVASNAPRMPARPMAAKPSLAEAKADKAKARSRGGEPSAAIAIRSNFNPLAAFAPAVKTDAAGRATVEVVLPDNLTRYRIVAIASAGDKQFGKGEGALTARLPLMVRPSPPRFLNFGDAFQLPVVVQNQTDAPMTVKVAVRATNAALTAGAGREVTVPANDRIEVQFPAAAELAGTARFQIVGAAGAASDAAELALPVWTPATTEAFATYGVIDDGAMRQPVALPASVVPQFGGLEVTTASTNLQALTDAMIYLVKYPFECAEQRASRVFAVAALQDVLAAFKAKDLPSSSAIQASVEADIERLAQLQNPNGGFPFWQRGRMSEPYVSAYVASALALAKQKGFVVPQDLLGRARRYLDNIEAHYPWYYSKEVRQAISAYALYVRKQLGDLDVAKAQKLLREAGGVAKVSMETNGWLLGVLAGQASAEAERKAILRHALNKVSETAGAASFTTSYGDGAYTLLASNHRVDAVMLDALIQEQKDLDLIPKLVTGLLAHRKAGRWLNTQENTFALLAMDRYFRTYESVEPDFVARVWLGNDYAGEHTFRGRTTDELALPIPMKEVAARDKQDLTIQKDGKGRLYYRIGMTYAPA